MYFRHCKTEQVLANHFLVDIFEKVSMGYLLQHVSIYCFLWKQAIILLD